MMQIPEHLKGLRFTIDNLDWMVNIKTNVCTFPGRDLYWEELPESAQMAMAAAVLITPREEGVTQCTLHGHPVQVWDDGDVFVRHDVPEPEGA